MTLIKPVNIAVVDDHHLFRSGLINLIHALGDNFKVSLESSNGQNFLKLLEENELPEIAIVDVNMPIMDGFETALHLKEKYPSIKVLVITMIEDETTLIKMLRLGIKGYLSKDVEPEELKEALISIAEKGFYYTDYVTGKLIESVNTSSTKLASTYLKDREQKFLELASTDLTYKEMADIMCISHKTVDGYRNALFERFGVKSRTGLVIYAIKNGLIKI